MRLNIPLILIFLTLLSGLVWVAHSLLTTKEKDEQKTKNHLPVMVDYAKSLFPIFLIVLIIRSFGFQLYRIPTDSLEPSVLVGDLVWVTQYSYGLFFPEYRWKLVSTSNPKIGDIAVFHWPVNTDVEFIKRIIGGPGDKISYINKTLYINGKEQDQKILKTQHMLNDQGKKITTLLIDEDLNGIHHKIRIHPGTKSHNFYNLTVPENNYFVMGDNRDDSDDSRDWGFVPASAFEGKAQYVILSWNSETHHMRWHRFGKKV